MSQHRNLTGFKNISKKIASRLNEAGIFSEDDLNGAVGAHHLIRERHPNESLPVCYYLYSFEGTLTDKHWDETSEPGKHQFKAQIDYHAAPDGNSATFHCRR